MASVKAIARSIRQFGEWTGQASCQAGIDAFDLSEQCLTDQPEGASEFVDVERTDPIILAAVASRHPPARTLAAADYQRVVPLGM